MKLQHPQKIAGIAFIRPGRAHVLLACRRGAASVFGLFLMMSLVVLMAMTIDLGNINVARSELRRTADAAAMAAAWQLLDEQIAKSSDTETNYQVIQAAANVASANKIANQSPMVSNQSQDVLLGRWDPASPSLFDTSSSADFNAVRVTVRRDEAVNGKVPLFFGQVFGVNGQQLSSTATAALLDRIAGFNTPPTNEQTIDLLPIALDLGTWQAVIAGTTSDNFTVNGTTVTSGGDGIPECNLYPQGTGSPGNRGTVDIGGANNSTADLSRQILHGISRQDFIDLGKPLVFDANGKLYLNGDTGISAGIKDELAAIIGQKRIIPIFQQVTGNGNNAMFEIVRFEGVQILEVKLTGSKNQKRVVIQPAHVIARGATYTSGGSVQSNTLRTPVMLVQ